LTTQVSISSVFPPKVSTLRFKPGQESQERKCFHQEKKTTYLVIQRWVESQGLDWVISDKKHEILVRNEMLSNLYLWRTDWIGVNKLNV